MSPSKRERGQADHLAGLLKSTRRTAADCLETQRAREPRTRDLARARNFLCPRRTAGAWLLRGTNGRVWSLPCFPCCPCCPVTKSASPRGAQATDRQTPTDRPAQSAKGGCPAAVGQTGVVPSVLPTQSASNHAYGSSMPAPSLLFCSALSSVRCVPEKTSQLPINLPAEAGGMPCGHWVSGTVGKGQGRIAVEVVSSPAISSDEPEKIDERTKGLRLT